VLGAGQREGAMDGRQNAKAVMPAAELRVIGATTLDEYRSIEARLRAGRGASRRSTVESRRQRTAGHLEIT